MGRRTQVIGAGIFHLCACGFAGDQPGHTVIGQRLVLIQTCFQREPLGLLIIERIDICRALKEGKVQVFRTPAALSHCIVYNGLSVQLERRRGAVMLAIHRSRHTKHQAAILRLCRLRILAVQFKQISHPCPVMGRKVCICFAHASQISVCHAVADDQNLRELRLAHAGKGAAVLECEFLRLVGIRNKLLLHRLLQNILTAIDRCVGEWRIQIKTLLHLRSKASGFILPACICDQVVYPYRNMVISRSRKIIADCIHRSRWDQAEFFLFRHRHQLIQTGRQGRQLLLLIIRFRSQRFHVLFQFIQRLVVCVSLVHIFRTLDDAKSLARGCHITEHHIGIALLIGVLVICIHITEHFLCLIENDLTGDTICARAFGHKAFLADRDIIR